MTQPTITDFLEARIAEDEAVALASIEQHAPDEWENETLTLNLWPQDVDLWSMTTPSRVLAECAAKRAIMKEHELDLHSSAPYCDGCAEWWASELGEGPPPVKYPCPTIRALAAVYAYHPDYQQEWAL